jgi:glycosyltransferase involved in cell wall biosynthesis
MGFYKIFSSHQKFIMKKVLIVNTVYEGGGAAQVARDLFFHFKENKEFSVFFAYGRGKKVSESNIFYFGNKIEFFVHLFLIRFLGLEGFGSYFSTVRLIKFIEKEKFDLIHLHNLHGYYINFFKLLKYLNKNNIKVAWTLHDEWLFTWLPAHSMDCTHCRTLIGKCTNRYNYPRNYWPIFSRFMLKKKKQIFSYNNIIFVCTAKWLFQEAKEEFKLSNVVLIPNGVDIKTFASVSNKKDLREKYNLLSDQKIILFLISNIADKNKGWQYLLKLAKRLEAKPYILGVVGADSLPKFSNLVNFGYINDRNKLAEIYLLSDLYCSLSAVETAPLSVLEAMSCALPVVGFNIKALDGLVSEKNGRLVGYGDDEKLADVINDIINDDILLRTLGECSRQIILNNFLLENNYSLYEKIYNL